LIGHAASTMGWVLTNPKNGIPVCRGAFAGLIFAYPLSAAGREITGNNGDFRDMYSQTAGRAIWSVVKRAYAVSNWSNLYFGIPGGIAQILGASPTTLYSFGNDNNKMFLQLAVASRTAGVVSPLLGYIDPEGKKLISAISNDNHAELYDLLGSILIGYKPKTDHIWWRGNFSMLDCGCNCVQTVLDPSIKDCIHVSKTPSGGDLNGNPWTTHNRWEWFTRDYDPNKDEVYEFAGIDYMEAYNAYRYKFFSGGYSQRLRYRFDAGAPLPSLCGPSWVGTFNNPIGMKAVFEIESRAKVYAAANHPSGQNGNLHFVVGSRIDLEPGFEVQDGARFDGRLGIYDCYPNYWSGYWGSYPCQATLAKGTADTIGQFTFYDPDTTVTIYNDEYNSTPDTIEYIDTTYITIDTVGDSIIIRLRECYDITPDNEIVNICDSSGNKSGRLLSWHRVTSTFNHLSLYPNPARDAAYIEYYLYDPHIVSVTLFNTMGQDISYAIDKYDKDQSPGNYKIRINTLGLPPGVYYCRIRMSDQETVKKLNVY
ncbi:MAG: T9SS type A sorting domain-containing protein, partial [Taibaiella sp.]|nr:T9SS type A sorting domain-containing protein [Taibaiella sp.]